MEQDLLVCTYVVMRTVDDGLLCDLVTRLQSTFPDISEGTLPDICNPQGGWFVRVDGANSDGDESRLNNMGPASRVPPRDTGQASRCGPELHDLWTCFLAEAIHTCVQV